MLKQPSLELQRQDTKDGFIQILLCDQAAIDRLIQLRERRIPQTDINSRLPCGCSGYHIISGHGIQLIQSHAVRHNNTPESEFSSQNIGQKLFVNMTENTVYFVISSHDSLHARRAAGLCRRKMNLAKLPHSNPRRACIYSARPLALRAEMLRDNRNALILHSFRQSLRHNAGQVRILSEALLASAPSRISENIQHGYQRQIHSHFRKLRAAHRAGALQKLRMKGGRGCQIHRQKISVKSLMSVRTFA